MGNDNAHNTYYLGPTDGKLVVVICFMGVEVGPHFVDVKYDLETKVATALLSPEKDHYFVLKLKSIAFSTRESRWMRLFL